MTPPLAGPQGFHRVLLMCSANTAFVFLKVQEGISCLNKVLDLLVLLFASEFDAA